MNGLPWTSIKEISNGMTPSELASIISKTPANWLLPNPLTIDNWSSIFTTVSISDSEVLNETVTESPIFAKEVLLLFDIIEIGEMFAGVSSIKTSAILCEPSVLFPGRSCIIALI